MIRFILVLVLLYSTPCKASDTLRLGSYEMAIPTGWTVKDDCTENDCSILAPRDNNEDTYLESINITINELGKLNYSVEKYANISVEYLPTVIEDFELLSRVKLPNNAAVLNYKGNKSAYNQTWKQYYFVVGTKMHILTFAAESKNYDTYINVIQENINSFIVK